MSYLTPMWLTVDEFYKQQIIPAAQVMVFSSYTSESPVPVIRQPKLRYYVYEINQIISDLL